MSLINEALKKAQHARVEGSPDATTPTASTPVRRGKARPGQMMMLLAVGALVLIVLSVVLTVFLLQRPTKPATSVATTSPSPSPTSDAPKAAASPSTASSTASVPEIRIPVPLASNPITTPPSAPDLSATKTAKATSVAKAEGPATVPSRIGPDAGSLPGVAPSDAAAYRLATPPPAPPVPPKPDDRISAFVDAVRVAGIRSSGGDSRVLMNDKVFRVSDIVERSLGIRLIKVEANTLTFSDANGVTYLKNF